METLKNLNKLWRTTALLQPTATTYSDVSDYRVYDKEMAVEDDAEEEEEEEEESFFELEVVMLNSRTRDDENGSFNNGRRVVPVEPDMKLKPHPDSPVSILKSAPKLKVSLFKKHINNNADLKLKQRPKVDDVEKLKLSKTKISTLIRESNGTSSPVSKQSMCKCKIENDDDSVSNDDSSSSKRLTKDVMHKYLKLKLIKPFHIKLAKRCASVNNNKSSRLFGVHKDCSYSVSSSPAPSSSISSSSSTSSSSSSSGFGIRVVCKQLGKSRSASSMMVGVGSVTRRDESLMVEHDDGGIQSAILHCKRSFNSSRDSSVHSSDSNSNCRDQESGELSV